MKAAAIIADWVTLLIDALDDLDRLIAVLSRMKDVLLITPARKFRILAHTNPTRQRGL
jgi:hypothetical protein